MYYQEMNSISFKASVQILYIVLCNYCTTCIIYRDKIKFKLTSSFFLNVLLFWFPAGQGLKKVGFSTFLKLVKISYDSEYTSYQNTSFIISF